jgi:hypothetical protein
MNPYILESNHFLVMCVVNLSVAIVLGKDINLYIVGRSHSPAMCVISHSDGRVM